MKITSLSKKYVVRRLDPEDVDIIYDMSCGNHIFYQYHPPFVTKQSILDDMEALPPGKSEEDKFYVGFFEGETLVAIMDLILGYPSDEIVYIGLFMMDVKFQGKGIGSDIICETVVCLREMGYREIRLGVDKGNPQSNSFWTKNGFHKIREDKYIEMSRKIEYNIE